jgi:hypothetical protein
MSSLIDLGRVIDETRGTYFSATMEDGVGKQDSDGMQHYATDCFARSIPHDRSPVSPV